VKTDEIRHAIRAILAEAVKKHEMPETHYTLAGETVPFGSQKCVNDLDHRIEDAKVRRDTCPGRSDSREHYNGILRVLRRELRGARKLLDPS